MDKTAEVVLAYWNEHRQQLRQSENQRAMLTNYILVITAALSGFIVQWEFRNETLALSGLIMIGGLYGVLTAAKYHERAEYHLSQARALTQTLVDMGALPNDTTGIDAARSGHYTKFRRLHRLRLHTLWTSFHGGIAVYGATLFTVALVR
jgi:hypothetical protein